MGSLDEQLVRRVAALEARVGKLGTAEVPALVVLPLPLASAAYSGDDTLTVGTHALDTSAAFGVPAGVRAVLVSASCAWAAPSMSSLLGLRPRAGLHDVAALSAASTDPQRVTALVPCDANGDLDVVVAGADALNVQLQIWGYLL